MLRMKILSVFLLVFSVLSFGQVAVGQWQDHLPYNHGTRVVQAGNYVYMVTNVGLMRYNLQNAEVEKLSKINGLSDVGVLSIAYHKNLNTIVIGYRSGNIDLIIGNQIYNISDIKRKSMSSDKAIYSISVWGNNVLLGCGFGIVVLDVQRKEIRETWFIGNQGTDVKINALDNDGTYVYAATDEGIYRGKLSDNLVDFSFWEVITNNVPANLNWMKNAKYNTLKIFHNKLVVNYDFPNQNNRDTIMVFDGNSWSYLNNTVNDVNSIDANNNILVVSAEYFAKIYDTALNEIRHIWKYFLPSGDVGPRPNSSFINDNDEIWIADKYSGLVHNPVSWKYTNVKINGPSNYNTFFMSAVNSELIAVAGAMNLSWGPLWRNPEFYIYKDNTWNNYSHVNFPEMSYVRDLVRVIFDPKDPTRYFIGSWVHGLLEFRNNQLYKIHNTSNSTLAAVPGIDYIRIGGMAFDDNGNLWVTNSLTSPQFHVLSPNGTWTAIDFGSMLSNYNIGQIIITRTNKKWVILPQGVGLFVFDDNGTPEDRSDDKFKKLSIIDETGQVISNEVYSIAEDKNGYIWVGTNKGVAVYYNPDDVFDSPNFSARQIKIPRNDGTDNADILLYNELVTAIKVDGANKKWFGTQSGGVYYTSSDGVQQIYHFTTENSPLLSNTIVCMEIIPKTGEVFFGTSSGLISYRNIATEGSDDYTGVYVFPNPVRPDYDGPITITGLVAGSYVKITDISGNLVYETRSEGGQAIWYGKYLNGNKVKTGVYLVFSSNDTGSKTDVAKILFLN